MYFSLWNTIPSHLPLWLFNSPRWLSYFLKKIYIFSCLKLKRFFSISLVCRADSMDHWYKNKECVNNIQSTFHVVLCYYTAISRKVVGKSARDNPERHCGWFWVLFFFQRNLKELVRKAMQMCLRVLKESNKSRFDRYSRQEPCTDHVPYYISGL